MGTLLSRFGEPVRMTLLDDDTSFCEALAAAVYGHKELQLLSYTTDPREIDEIIRTQAPDVVLVDHGLGHESGLRIGERVAKANPAVMVFLITDSASRELWKQAVASGLRDIIRKPPMTGREEMAQWVNEELRQAILDAVEMERRQLARVDDGKKGAEDGVAVVRAPSAPRTVAVWSAKGGAGKTTVAVNLALWAQANPISKVPTVLVDLEEGAGATHALLGMPARPTLLDWLDYTDDDEVDPAVVAKRVAQHTTGLHCVFAPDSLLQSAEITGKLTRTVIRSLRATHGLVVVDCPPTVTEPVGAALEMATVVLVVVPPEIPAINKIHKALNDLARQGLDMSKIRILVNRIPRRPAIGEGEIARALSWVVVGGISEDPDLHLAVNRHRPPALYAPDGIFMTGLRKAMAKIIPGLEIGSVRPSRRRFRLWPFVKSA
ncbi:MAG TPA: response regulator [Calditerricola sp.]